VLSLPAEEDSATLPCSPSLFAVTLNRRAGNRAETPTIISRRFAGSSAAATRFSFLHRAATLDKWTQHAATAVSIHPRFAHDVLCSAPIRFRRRCRGGWTPSSVFYASAPQRGRRANHTTLRCEALSRQRTRLEEFCFPGHYGRILPRFETSRRAVHCCARWDGL